MKLEQKNQIGIINNALSCVNIEVGGKSYIPNFTLATAMILEERDIDVFKNSNILESPKGIANVIHASLPIKIQKDIDILELAIQIDLSMMLNVAEAIKPKASE
ncbi:hypothetical protein LCGC14_0405090 [marine sediment metagenome]|uniref:Uncharacterized protein n=1 Tax=marine sediment metagenome TaxID=412755 RepID=A0A0F9SVE9_9ZZZZ